MSGIDYAGIRLDGSAQVTRKLFARVSAALGRVIADSDRPPPGGPGDVDPDIDDTDPRMSLPVPDIDVGHRP